LYLEIPSIDFNLTRTPVHPTYFWETGRRNDQRQWLMDQHRRYQHSSSLSAIHSF
jgi:hypothetical protein